MKIGVAFSGSGAGAAAANVFADELLKRSVAVDMALGDLAGGGSVAAVVAPGRGRRARKS